jgi:hypothetical protein
MEWSGSFSGKMQMLREVSVAVLLEQTARQLAYS